VDFCYFLSLFVIGTFRSACSSVEMLKGVRGLRKFGSEKVWFKRTDIIYRY